MSKTFAPDEFKKGDRNKHKDEICSIQFITESRLHVIALSLTFCMMYQLSQALITDA